MNNIIAQIIGAVALGMAIISFQQNTRKKILLFQLIAGSIFSIHFLLLGAYTGAALNALSVCRNIIFYNKSKKWASHIHWLFLFIFVSIIVGILTWENIITLFAMTGMVLGSVSFWLDNPKYVRRLSFPISMLWIVYNIVNKSYAGILTELFVMSSVIIGIFRFDIKKNKNIATVNTALKDMNSAK